MKIIPQIIDSCKCGRCGKPASTLIYRKGLQYKVYYEEGFPDSTLYYLDANVGIPVCNDCKSGNSSIKTSKWLIPLIVAIIPLLTFTAIGVLSAIVLGTTTWVILMWWKPPIDVDSHPIVERLRAEGWKRIIFVSDNVPPVDYQKIVKTLKEICTEHNYIILDANDNQIDFQGSDEEVVNSLLDTIEFDERD